ncbi:hypothetical protein TrCOL_g9443 [Triparma columacea]|uniref:EamA domain-containing protein n=1 Tax=Triparma columacea TaxID=722753 RepID=A0A9W7G075_9STRA|nr:hypothetical protein TrCOL_g9443 [Triparma columacea]
MSNKEETRDNSTTRPPSPTFFIIIVTLLWSSAAVTAKLCINEANTISDDSNDDDNKDDSSTTITNALMTVWLGSSSLSLLSCCPGGAVTFSLAPVFVYALSAAFLNFGHTNKRAAAVAVAIAGVALTVSPTLSSPTGPTGVILMSLSAFTAACYKVTLNSLYPLSPPSFISTLLSRVGLIALTTMWIPVLISSQISPSSSSPSPLALWSPSSSLLLPLLQFLHSLFVLSFNFTVNYAASSHPPIYVSLATLLGVPVTGVMSCFILGEESGPYTVAGGAVTVAGAAGLVYEMRGGEGGRREGGEGKGEDEVPLKEGG